jgi:hypothetical protein
MPMTPATIVQPSDSPSDGPMNPIGIVKYWKLPRNQSGAWCQTLPCRSLSGIQSMDRTSMPRMPPPLPLLGARAGAESLSVATGDAPLAKPSRSLRVLPATVMDARGLRQ